MSNLVEKGLLCGFLHGGKGFVSSWWWEWAADGLDVEAESVPEIRDEAVFKVLPLVTLFRMPGSAS